MQPSNVMSVSQNGVDLRNASASQLVFSSQYPFAKLDRTNNVSFQNISILFNTEPPNPDGISVFTLTTLVYKFAHGYTYVPSTWFMMQNPSPGSVGLQPAYQQEGGDIIITNEADGTSAVLSMQADSTNVYLYVTKNYTSGDTLPNIQGFSINIRIYVFAGDLTGTTGGS